MSPDLAHLLEDPARAAEIPVDRREGTEGGVADSDPAPYPKGSPTSVLDQPGNSGPIPTVPENSHSYSRPSPRNARAARPKEGKEDL